MWSGSSKPAAAPRPLPSPTGNGSMGVLVALACMINLFQENDPCTSNNVSGSISVLNSNSRQHALRLSAHRYWWLQLRHRQGDLDGHRCTVRLDRHSTHNCPSPPTRTTILVCSLSPTVGTAAPSLRSIHLSTIYPTVRSITHVLFLLASHREEICTPATCRPSSPRFNSPNRPKSARVVSAVHCQQRAVRHIQDR
jgi:hypothetical protein